MEPELVKKMDEESAGVVIFRKEEDKLYYLILHYPAGHYEFAKGHIEPGETAKDAALRETVEETTINDLEFLDFEEKISYYYSKDGKPIQKQVIFFLAQTQTKDVSTSFEHTGFEWLEYEKASKRVTYDNAKKILEKADKFLRSGKFYK